VVDEAVQAGLRDLLIITGRSKRAIEDHFDRSPELEQALAQSGKHADLQELLHIAELAHIHYVRQPEAKGLGNAVSYARHHVGDEPFVVMLGDDIMVDHTVLTRMVEAYEKYHCSVIAVKRFPANQISSYGCIDPGAFREDGLIELQGIVEKPRPEDAPSDLAVMGRYLFTPRIFDMIDKTPPGRGGEIQLTDAIGLLLAEEPVLGVVFEEGRYDIGSKQDFLRATVEFALRRPDLGADFKEYLREIVASWK
jgi:UTP--glucose-1-phosphate uridylyltransferase